jgi:hypothetical protein
MQSCIDAFLTESTFISTKVDSVKNALTTVSVWYQIFRTIIGGIKIERIEELKT